MKRYLITLLAIFFTLNILALSPQLSSAASGTPLATGAAASSTCVARLKNVKSWACQLQGLEVKGAVAKIVSSKYDLVVVEPTKTEKGLKAFDTKKMVSQIKKSGKLVFAYANIAEAEDWRYYWTWSKTNKKTWPKYIIDNDPDGWAGDYPVAYWKKDWQSLLFSKIIDEALADGFDGIYMDWVGAYDQALVLARAKLDKVNAHKEMVSLLGKIRTYTRAKNTNFMMIQQNAVELHKGFPNALQYVDAISEEAIWYDGTSFDKWNDKNGMDKKTPSADTKNYIANLKVYKAAGKPVFALEYALKYKNAAVSLAKKNGFIAYCSRRALSQLS